MLIPLYIARTRTHSRTQHQKKNTTRAESYGTLQPEEQPVQTARPDVANLMHDTQNKSHHSLDQLGQVLLHHPIQLQLGHGGGLLRVCMLLGAQVSWVLAVTIVITGGVCQLACSGGTRPAGGLSCCQLCPISQRVLLSTPTHWFRPPAFAANGPLCTSATKTTRQHCRRHVARSHLEAAPQEEVRQHRLVVLLRYGSTMDTHRQYSGHTHGQYNGVLLSRHRKRFSVPL